MSHNHDKLAQLWRDRETRDACGASVTLKIDPTTHAIVGLSATSTQSCKLAVTGGNSSQVTNEKYGPDTTMWLSIFTILKGKALFFYLYIIFENVGVGSTPVDANFFFF